MAGTLYAGLFLRSHFVTLNDYIHLWSIETCTFPEISKNFYLLAGSIPLNPPGMILCQKILKRGLVKIRVYLSLYNGRTDRLRFPYDNKNQMFTLKRILCLSKY